MFDLDRDCSRVRRKGSYLNFSPSFLLLTACLPRLLCFVSVCLHHHRHHHHQHHHRSTNTHWLKHSLHATTLLLCPYSYAIPPCCFTSASQLQQCIYPSFHLLNTLTLHARPAKILSTFYIRTCSIHFFIHSFLTHLRIWFCVLNNQLVITYKVDNCFVWNYF